MCAGCAGSGFLWNPASQDQYGTPLIRGVCLLCNRSGFQQMSQQPQASHWCDQQPHCYHTVVLDGYDRVRCCHCGRLRDDVHGRYSP